MSDLRVRFNKQSIVLGAIALAVTGFAANALRYETTALSKNTYIVSDRWTGALSFCNHSKCRPVEPRPEPRPGPKNSLDETMPTGNLIGADDWSRLNDAQLMEAVLGEPLDCYGLTPPVGIECASEDQSANKTKAMAD